MKRGELFSEVFKLKLIYPGSITVTTAIVEAGESLYQSPRGSYSHSSPYIYMNHYLKVQLAK